jgi:hypothetical protein
MKNRFKICRSIILGDFSVQNTYWYKSPPTLQNAFPRHSSDYTSVVDTYVRNNIVTKEHTTSSRIFSAPELSRATSQRANE